MEEGLHKIFAMIVMMYMWLLCSVVASSVSWSAVILVESKKIKLELEYNIFMT